MNCIPYIYIRTRAREACGPSSRRNTLQMSRLAIIFFFFSFSIFSSARRGVGSAHPSPYPVLPSRRCPARPASMPRAPCVDALTHGPTGRRATHHGPRVDARAVGPSSRVAQVVESSSRRAVEPSGRRAYAPSVARLGVHRATRETSTRGACPEAPSDARASKRLYIIAVTA